MRSLEKGQGCRRLALVEVCPECANVQTDQVFSDVPCLEKREGRSTKNETTFNFLSVG